MGAVFGKKAYPCIQFIFEPAAGPPPNSRMLVCTPSSDKARRVFANVIRKISEQDRQYMRDLSTLCENLHKNKITVVHMGEEPIESQTLIHAFREVEAQMALQPRKQLAYRTLQFILED